MLDAYESSLKDGEGSGRKPSTVYGIQMAWKPEEGRKKSLFYQLKTRDEALRLYRAMRKYPVENEEVTFLVGTVEWETLDLPE